MSGAEGGAELTAKGYSVEASTKIAVRASRRYRDAKYKDFHARLPGLAGANNRFAGCSAAANAVMTTTIWETP
jgi:hypothetical protein